ncbi:hypothetical protein ASD38_19500 [Caulobacter sp. Root487D2Y]|uniref:hypothetical protein n=1 Tax=Caulobacter sp. Root487D2Y TaxID=1736547 RepID=UPI0006FA9CCD|nr:hypothetical protein [Caulobacter sp. Root487D2Y]KQY26434.1 hypothetical protein ASD38_19500 [Caulobacter sp. Root487D2Y]
MRLAYVQLGGGFPTLETQVLRIMPLRPDDYAIEETPTDAARRRVSERLEALGPGDQLCVWSLDVFNGPAKDMSALIAGLLDRGVVVETFDDEGERIEIGQSKAEKLLMSWLGQVFAGCEAAPKRRTAPSNLEVLSDDEVAEIQRLARAGLTARRIGLIFRRSPKCIEGVLDSAGLRAGVQDLNATGRVPQATPSRYARR